MYSFKSIYSFVLYNSSMNNDSPLREIINYLPFLIWYKDTEGRFLVVNQEFIDASSEFSREAILGKTDLDLWPRELALKYRLDDDLVIKSKKAKLVEEHVEVNGIYTWFETFKIPVIVDNQVVGTIGFSRDITDRKVIEGSISTEKTFLKILLQNIPDLLWMKDMKGMYLSSNKRFQDFFNVKENEIIGKTDYDFLGKNLGDLFSLHDEDVLNSNSPLTSEKVITFDEGINREILETTQTVIENEDGDVIGVLGIGHDITERKNIENRLLIIDAYKDIIIQMSIKLINLPINQITQAVYDTLKVMAEFTSSDRAYIFEYDFEKNITNNTYEWCKEGISPQMDILQNLNLDDISDVVNTHLNGECVEIENVNELPDGSFKDFLKPKMIQSLLTLPLVLEGKTIGFVGFDRCRIKEKFTTQSRELLTLFAELLVNVKQRQISDNKLQLAGNVFEHAREGIMVVDQDVKIQEVNQSFSRITGYSKEEALGMNPNMLQSGLMGNNFYKAMWSALRKYKYWEGEIWNRKKNGELYIQLSTITAIDNVEGDTIEYIALFSDITEIKGHEDQLQKMAHYDALTGLPNRVLFNDRLQLAIETAKHDQKKVALLFIDLDRFKEINDSFGHNAGDEILKTVSQRLKNIIGEKDTVSRLGGDEFSIIVEGVDKAEDVSILAKKILNVLSQEIMLDDNTLYISTSIGISMFPGDGGSSQNLLKYADSAMYKAKDEGRNNFQYYNSSMTELAFERVVMEASLRIAIKEEELVVYYQPQIDGRTDVIIGMEALVRWNHPSLGLVSPGRFISLAESTGIIVKLDRIVMKTAMRQFSKWYESGLNPGTLAMNLSVKQLKEEDFIDNLKSLLKDTGCKPEWIELEVTEGQIMTNPEEAIKILKRISDLGITLAVDDFGTGYSSLAYLKKLPIDKLKIDQVFVKDLPDDEEDSAITKAVIALASSLNLRVLAEGVETKEQKEFLVNNGCNNIQGYFYFPPMSATEMEEVLKPKVQLF